MAEEEELIESESAGESEGHGAEGDHDDEPKRKKRKPTNIRVAALNITSFLDMSFCLLTFLILSASLTAPEGVLSAKLPVGEGGNVQLDTKPPEKELRILLSSTSVENCRIMIEGLPEATPDFKSLTEQLKRLQFSDSNAQGVYKADNPIIIKPDNNCHWQHIVNAFNAAVAAKFTNVSFASPSHEE